MTLSKLEAHGGGLGAALVGLNLTPAKNTRPEGGDWLLYAVAGCTTPRYPAAKFLVNSTVTGPATPSPAFGSETRSSSRRPNILNVLPTFVTRWSLPVSTNMCGFTLACVPA